MVIIYASVISFDSSLRVFALDSQPQKPLPLSLYMTAFLFLPQQFSRSSRALEWPSADNMKILTGEGLHNLLLLITCLREIETIT